MQGGIDLHTGKITGENTETCKGHKKLQTTEGQGHSKKLILTQTSNY
jgi:hypothetical protein